MLLSEGSIQTCASGETKAFKQGAYWHVHFFHEAAERKRPPRAQERLPTCPKTCHLASQTASTARETSPRNRVKTDPSSCLFSRPAGWPPKNLPAAGSGRETRANLTVFGGFPRSHSLSTDQQSWTQTKAWGSFRNYGTHDSRRLS